MRPRPCRRRAAGVVPADLRIETDAVNCEETCATFKEWVRDKQHALQLARCTRCKGYSQPYVRCHYFHLFRYRTKYKDWKCRNQGLSPEGPCPSAGHSRDTLQYCNSLSEAGPSPQQPRAAVQVDPTRRRQRLHRSRPG